MYRVCACHEYVLPDLVTENYTFLSPSTSPQISIHDFVITNVIPGDFTYDGKLDLLVMGQKDPRSDPDGEIFMRLYKGDGNSTFGKFNLRNRKYDAQ